MKTHEGRVKLLTNSLKKIEVIFCSYIAFILLLMIYKGKTLISVSIFRHYHYKMIYIDISSSDTNSQPVTNYIIYSVLNFLNYCEYRI